MVQPKNDKNSFFANSLQFSSTGQCTNIPGRVRGTIPAHTNTPCSHQRMDKQGLFLPCNKSGIGKLSTGLRKQRQRTGNKASPSCRKNKSLFRKLYRKSQTLLCHPAKAARSFGIEKTKKKRTRLDSCKRELGD